MTIVQNRLHDGLARQALEDRPHYVTKVTDMAEHKEVLSSEDVLTEHGLKLIGKNVRITSKLREGLLKHKLLKPLDLFLVVSDGLTPELLAREVDHLIKTDPNLQRLVTRSGDAMALHHGHAKIPLTSQMAFKLTVAKEQQPALFQHLLLTALIANYLAVRTGLSEHDTINVLSAALFHDLGELHTDPALLDPKHRITEAERRHIDVHPITGYLIVKEAAGLDASVAVAVLQHQEKLDGSGYPYGLTADRIGLYARMVGISGVSASLLARFGNNDRLSTFMRLNRHKFDPKLLALLHEGFFSESDTTSVAEKPLFPKLTAVARLLEKWAKVRTVLSNRDGGKPPQELFYLIERMATTRSMLMQFGFDPEDLESLAALAADEPLLAHELGMALDEMFWQFADLEREMVRRRKNMLLTLRAEETRFVDTWIEALRAYLHIS